MKSKRPGQDFCYWCDKDFPHVHAERECTIDALQKRYADLHNRMAMWPDFYIDDKIYSYAAFRDMQDSIRELRYQNDSYRELARENGRCISILESAVDKIKRYAIWIGNDKAHGVMDKLNELMKDV